MSWNYADWEYQLSVGLLVSSMVGMGTTLTARDFFQVMRSPVAMLLAIFVQVLITPLLALGLAKLLSVPPEIRVGLLIVSSLPGGMFSNLLTYLGRGNVALSVAATAVCSLGCLFTTTFVLNVYALAFLPPDFAMPAQRILLDIGLYLLFPLAIGMILRRVAPRGYARIGTLCIRLSVVLLGVIILGAVTSGRIQVDAYGWRTPLVLLLFGVASLWVTYGICLLMKQTLANSFTLGIEVVLRNSHLGVMLKAALFPADAAGSNALGDGVFFVVLFYGLASLLIAGIEVFAHRNQTGLLFGSRSPASAFSPSATSHRENQPG
jgi:BASS family bile acid:Na+ symporter